MLISSLCSVELYKMVCEHNETGVNINISAVMLPQDAGSSLESILASNRSGNVLVPSMIYGLSSHFQYNNALKYAVNYSNSFNRSFLSALKYALNVASNVEQKSK